MDRLLAWCLVPVFALLLALTSGAAALQQRIKRSPTDTDLQVGVIYEVMLNSGDSIAAILVSQRTCPGVP